MKDEKEKCSKVISSRLRMLRMLPRKNNMEHARLRLVFTFFTVSYLLKAVEAVRFEFAFCQTGKNTKMHCTIFVNIFAYFITTLKRNFRYYRISIFVLGLGNEILQAFDPKCYLFKNVLSLFRGSFGIITCQ